MGWVEIVETLKQIGKVPMPEGVDVYFSTKLNGLTYGRPCVSCECRNGHFDWHISRVPSTHDLNDWRMRLDQFIAAGER